MSAVAKGLGLHGFAQAARRGLLFGASTLGLAAHFLFLALAPSMPPDRVSPCMQENLDAQFGT